MPPLRKLSEMSFSEFNPTITRYSKISDIWLTPCSSSKTVTDSGSSQSKGNIIPPAKCVAKAPPKAR